MKDKTTIKCLLFSLLLALSPAHAQKFAGDSVMNPSNNTSSSNVNSSAGNLSLPTYTSANLNDIQYASCPAGFNHNGSSQYPLQIRTLTNYYLNGNYVGQSQGTWYDTDASCNAVEYQTIGCPVNYTGNQLQSRLVSTSNGYYDYGAWNTYQNNCVYVPPRKAGVMSGNITSVRGVTFGAWGSPQVGATLDYANAALRCTSYYPSSGGGDAGNAVYPSSWTVYGLGQNTAYGGGDSGTPASCSMSNGNQTATLNGNCDSTSGGDGDFCQGVTVKVNITSVSGCTVYVQTTGRGTNNYSYNICQ